jgi:hypothetical protein
LLARDGTPLTVGLDEEQARTPGVLDFDELESEASLRPVHNRAPAPNRIWASAWPASAVRRPRGSSGARVAVAAWHRQLHHDQAGKQRPQDRVDLDQAGPQRP